MRKMADKKAIQSAADGRTRLIETARQLFTRRGTAHVGINEVTEEAGVARMTLYNNFPSKQALSVAVYQEMAEKALARLDEIFAAGMSESGRIEKLFAHFGRNAHRPDYRGCSFIHASLQEADPHGPIYAIVQTYKRALRKRIETALDARRLNRAELAGQIVLLLDGGVTEAYIKGVNDPMAAAQKAAMVLLAQ